VPFYEYFHGDDGTGLGAAHQTGWTALVVDLIITLHESAPPSADRLPPATRSLMARIWSRSRGRPDV
jgi:hypothetical protein